MLNEQASHNKTGKLFKLVYNLLTTLFFIFLTRECKAEVCLVSKGIEFVITWWSADGKN